MRDESLRQLEQVRKELQIKNEESAKITDQNTVLKKEVPTNFSLSFNDC